MKQGLPKFALLAFLALLGHPALFVYGTDSSDGDGDGYSSPSSSCQAEIVPCSSDPTASFTSYLQVKFAEPLTTISYQSYLTMEAALGQAYDRVAGTVCDTCQRRLTNPTLQFPEILVGGRRLQELDHLHHHHRRQLQDASAVPDTTIQADTLVFAFRVQQTGHCTTALDVATSPTTESTTTAEIDWEQRFEDVCGGTFVSFPLQQGPDATATCCCAACPMGDTTTTDTTTMKNPNIGVTPQTLKAAYTGLLADLLVLEEIPHVVDVQEVAATQDNALCAATTTSQVQEEPTVTNTRILWAYNADMHPDQFQTVLQSWIISYNTLAARACYPRRIQQADLWDEDGRRLASYDSQGGGYYTTHQHQQTRRLGRAGSASLSWGCAPNVCPAGGGCSLFDLCRRRNLLETDQEEPSMQSKVAFASTSTSSSSSNSYKQDAQRELTGPASTRDALDALVNSGDLCFCPENAPATYEPPNLHEFLDKLNLNMNAAGLDTFSELAVTDQQENPLCDAQDGSQELDVRSTAWDIIYETLTADNAQDFLDKLVTAWNLQCLDNCWAERILGSTLRDDEGNIIATWGIGASGDGEAERRQLAANRNSGRKLSRASRSSSLFGCAPNICPTRRLEQDGNDSSSLFEKQVVQPVRGRQLQSGNLLAGLANSGDACFCPEDAQATFVIPTLPQVVDRLNVDLEDAGLGPVTSIVREGLNTYTYYVPAIVIGASCNDETASVLGALAQEIYNDLAVEVCDPLQREIISSTFHCDDESKCTTPGQVRGVFEFQVTSPEELPEDDVLFASTGARRLGQQDSKTRHLENICTTPDQQSFERGVNAALAATRVASRVNFLFSQQCECDSSIASPITVQGVTVLPDNSSPCSGNGARLRKLGRETRNVNANANDRAKCGLFDCPNIRR